MKSVAIEHLEVYRKEFDMLEYFKEINRHVEKGECNAENRDRFYKTLMEATFKAIPSLRNKKLDVEKDYERIKGNEDAINELFRTYTVMGMISAWLEFKQIYKFDKDTLDTLLEKDSDDITCEELLALKMPYGCFAIENEMAYGNDIIDTIFVNRTKCDSGDVLLSVYGFIKTGSKETRLVRLDNLIDKDKTLFDFLEKDANDEAKRFMKKFMNLILYLCQPKVDVLVKKGKSLSNPKKEKDMPKSFYAVAYDENEVGCRLGSAIRNYRVLYENNKDSDDTNRVKRVVKPHTRCGHFHHYWTGKGRTDLIVKYIEPTFVLGGSKTATMHKVKK